MTRAVVSFANTDFYKEKMKRLQESVEAQGIKFIGYKSFEEVGCKPHSEIPYAFKPYAIRKAWEDGITSLLWCDSPVVAIKDLSPVFDYIEKHELMFFNNIGHPLGKWSNEKLLNWFGWTREYAMGLPQIMACCMGFNFNEKKPRQLFWDYYMKADELYPGSWDDHRHDQATISALIQYWGLGNKILTAHETYFAYEHFKDVPGWKIADSVCLISR